MLRPRKCFRTEQEIMGGKNPGNRYWRIGVMLGGLGLERKMVGYHGEGWFPSWSYDGAI